jgi:hypothetical protein
VYYDYYEFIPRVTNIGITGIVIHIVVAAVLVHRIRSFPTRHIVVRSNTLSKEKEPEQMTNRNNYRIVNNDEKR